ncbi:MAG: type I 3-dehydroquinate dehydratase [Desulfobulbaceae bacterium]|nr:type I 3-dehydroquinate dehydratase [Desulfobulbaceae bacterium]
MTGLSRVCVSIAESDLATALGVARATAPLTDLLEIRLDYLATPDYAAFLADLPGNQLLFTCRPEWEGGRYGGGEESRLALLAAAAAAGAAFVDIELRTAEPLRSRLIKSAREAGAKVVVSWHDFKTTASRQALESILQEQYRSGADWGKIVTTPRDFQDVLRVLALQEPAAEIGFPLCAFCMGSIGVISRVATMGLGGVMTYAAPDGGAPAAPGQLPISALRRIRENLHGAG